MIILRQNNYSEKKLKSGDRINLWLIKHATPRSMKKLIKDLGDDDDDVRNKAIKKSRKLKTALGATQGAVFGHDLVGILPGAAIGGAIHCGADKLAEEGKLGKKIKNKRDINRKKNKDAVLVSDGEMSEEEFIKKWGKEKKC